MLLLQVFVDCLPLAEITTATLKWKLLYLWWQCLDYPREQWLGRAQLVKMHHNSETLLKVIFPLLGSNKINCSFCSCPLRSWCFKKWNDKKAGDLEGEGELPWIIYELLSNFPIGIDLVSVKCFAWCLSLMRQLQNALKSVSRTC